MNKMPLSQIALVNQRKPLRVPRIAGKPCYSQQDVEAVLRVFEKLYRKQIARYEALLRELCEGDRTVRHMEDSRWMRLWDNFLYGGSMRQGPGPFQRLAAFPALVREAMQAVHDAGNGNSARQTADRYWERIAAQVLTMMADFHWVDRMLEMEGLAEYSPRRAPSPKTPSEIG